MPCRPTCVQPSPTNAHCSACHTTFGGITGFDRHRRGGQCHDPALLEMHRDSRGVWRFAAPDPTRRVVWPQAVPA